MNLPWAKNKKQSVRRSPTLMEGQDSYIFRRSRTITGTSSPSVTAGAESRGHLKTDRLKLIELRAHRQQILKLLGGVIAAAAILAFLLANFIASPNIVYAQKGTRQPQADTYQQSIYRYFDDHPFERFGFLLHASDIESSLLRDHTELLSVSVQRDWYGGNVHFITTFRQPLLAWKVGNKQFYVDTHGIAFTYNHFAEPKLSVTDQSGVSPDQSGAVASTRFIRFLGQIVGAVNGYGKGQVTSVIIPPALREIDLKLQGRDYSIKTNTDRDPLQEAEDIANALTYFDQKKIKPQYIDVRVEHKAFYK